MTKTLTKDQWNIKIGKLKTKRQHIMDLNYPLTLFISFNLVTPLCDEACAEKKIKFDKTNEEKKAISIPRVIFLFLPIKKKFE